MLIRYGAKENDRVIAIITRKRPVVRMIPIRFIKSWRVLFLMVVIVVWIIENVSLFTWENGEFLCFATMNSNTVYSCHGLII